MVFIPGTTQEEEMQELQQENIQLKSDLQALRERLKEIEWKEDNESGYEVCPACDGDKPEGRKWATGHIKSCWLAAELDKLKGVE